MRKIYHEKVLKMWIYYYLNDSQAIKKEFERRLKIASRKKVPDDVCELIIELKNACVIIFAGIMGLVSLVFGLLISPYIIVREFFIDMLNTHRLKKSLRLWFNEDGSFKNEIKEILENEREEID